MAQSAPIEPSRSASTITLAIVVLLALLSIPSGQPGATPQLFDPNGSRMQSPFDSTGPGVSIRAAGADIIGDGECTFIFTPNGDSVPVGNC